MFANPTVELVVETLTYIGLAFLLFLIGRIVFSLTHQKISLKEELVKKDNFAFALSNIGYYVGLLITIGSVIIGPSYGLLTDILDILAFGFLAIILLNISSFVNDKLILRKFSVSKEIIVDRNAGTGVVHAANYIASGLIIFGAVYGEAINFFPDSKIGFLLSGVLLALIFWGVGQLVLLLTSFVYNMILPYDIHDQIEKDNVAVGVGYAGAIVAIAILISHAVAGDFYSWTEHFIKIGIEILIGFLLLPLIRLFTDKVLLPGENITDEIVNQEHPNVGAALIEAFAYISGAMIITWCL